MRRLGWFGGSFNPVHAGHIRMANRLLRLLDLVYLMPAKENTGKRVIASHHRLAMLRLALQRADNRILIDERELDRSGTTFTIDSLRDIRAAYTQDQVNFVLGADSLLTMNHWKDYSKLTDYANLIILERKGASRMHPGKQFASWLRARTVNEQQWRTHLQSCILFYDTGTIDCSSTDIRSALTTGTVVDDGQIDARVMDYIRQEKLYQYRQDAATRH